MSILRSGESFTCKVLYSKDGFPPPCSQILRHFGLSVLVLNRFRGMLVSPSPFGSKEAP